MATVTEDAKADNRIVFRVDDRLNETLRIAAVKSKMSIQELCTAAVERYLTEDLPAA